MARIRPQTGFETTLSSGLTAVATTIGVTTAPTETSGYMVIEPGTSNKEIIKYTGVSGTTLTGVSRGLALTGSSDAAGTGKIHAAGSTVSMTNVHYYLEQLANKTEANTFTAEQTFETANINIGDGTTDENEQITANNGDASKPFVRYSAADNKWLISNNGTDTYDPQAGGSGVTAGDGIDINAGAVTVDPTDPILGLRININAGETINGATLPVAIYQNASDNEIYACDGDDKTKLEFIGFAVSNSTDGNPIQVVTNGIVSGFTGLAEGTLYYVQDDKTIGMAKGSWEVLVGRAVSETQLLIIKERFEDLIAGSTLMASADTIRTTSSTTYVKLKDISINQRGGMVTVKFTMREDVNPGGTAYARIYVNDVAVGTERTRDDETLTEYSENITIKRGDNIQIYAKHSTGSYTCSVLNFRIYRGSPQDAYTLVFDASV